MFGSLQKIHPSSQRKEVFLNLSYSWAKNYPQPATRLTLDPRWGTLDNSESHKKMRAGNKSVTTK